MKLLARILILLCVIGVCSAQVERPVSGPLMEKPDEAKLFKWFDGLDFDAVRNASFVKVRQNGLDLDEPRYGYGFQISPSQILSLDLNFSSRAPDKQDLGYLQGPYYLDFKSVEPCDFAFFAKEQLPILYGPDASDKRRLIQGFVEAFVISRACEARGLPDLAQKYFLWATQSRYQNDFTTRKATYSITGPLPPGQGEQGRVLGEWVDLSGYNDVVHTIARSQYVNAVERFADVRISWSNHLKAFQRIQRMFGEVDKTEPTSEFVTILTKMVNEKPAPAGKEYEVDRLIQALPEENARQFMHPGGAEVFGFGGTSANSPAHKLAKIGRNAVPKLLNAMGDRRLTRSVEGDWRGQRILRVSDIVLQTLDEVTGRNLRRLPPKEIKTAALAWYNEAGKVGELDLLKRGLAKDQYWAAGNKIIEKYQNQSGEIFLEAFKKPLPEANHSYLLDEIASDKNAIPALKEEALHGRVAKDRIYAAGCVSKSDPVFACVALVKELAIHKDPEGYSVDMSFPHPSIYVSLVENGQPAAIEALARVLPTLSVQDRSEILRDFVDKYTAKSNSKSMSLAETLLVSELGDQDTDPILGAVNDTDYRSSMCDRAAHALSSVFPSKYAEKEFEFESDRREQRRRFENIWLVSQGRPAMSSEMPAPVAATDKSLVVAVEITGQGPANSAIASTAKGLANKRLTFAALKSLADSFAGLAMPKGRYTRLLVTREASGAGLTIHLDFNRHGSGDVGGDGPCKSLHMRIGHHIVGAGSGGVELIGYADEFKQCLAAPSNRRIDIEYDYWSQN